MPSSAVQYVLDSPSQMTIYRPNDMNSVMMFAVVGLVFSIFILIVAAFAKGGRASVLLIPFIVVFCLVLAYGPYTDRATAVLSKSQGTLTITHNRATDTYPLQSVMQAGIQLSDGTPRMIFVLKDGQYVPLGRFAERDGISLAVSAANNFLLSSTTGTSVGSKSPPPASAPEDPAWLKEMKRKSDLQEKDYQERLRKGKAGKE